MTNPIPVGSEAPVAEHKKEELLPDIDFLSLAEERAASAPLSDFGVYFLNS